MFQRCHSEYFWTSGTVDHKASGEEATKGRGMREQGNERTRGWGMYINSTYNYCNLSFSIPSTWYLLSRLLANHFLLLLLKFQSRLKILFISLCFLGYLAFSTFLWFWSALFLCPSILGHISLVPMYFEDIWFISCLDAWFMVFAGLRLFAMVLEYVILFAVG